MHWDDSQKLFRVGPKSAMVIAGFASYVRQGSPLDVQVASVFREEFTDREWKTGKRSVTELSGLIGTTVGYQLQLFGALLATNRPPPPVGHLNFQVLAAEINKRGKIQIVRIGFKPRIQLWGSFNLAAPSYDVNSTTSIVDHFVAISAGMDSVAQAILSGTLESQDNRILSFHRARSANQLDELSLDALEGLAIAILEETKHSTPFVGGQNQVAVFDKKRLVKWKMPELPTDRQKLVSTIMRIGSTYTRDGLLTFKEYSEAKGKNLVTEMNVALTQPFEMPFTQVFIGSLFRGVSVSLDGNVFAGNRFSQVTFKYQGGPVYFAMTNTIENCVLEVPPNIQIPPELSACRVVLRPAVLLDETVGSPIRARPQGCVSRNSEGRIIIKTKGRQKGKDCKGSKVVIPKIFP
jgi:20S proteasome alpha/beta subunit